MPPAPLSANGPPAPARKSTKQSQEPKIKNLSKAHQAEFCPATNGDPHVQAEKFKIAWPQAEAAWMNLLLDGDNMMSKSTRKPLKQLSLEETINKRIQVDTQVIETTA